MSEISKPWDWKSGKSDIWLQPSEESYYLAVRWKNAEYKALLDFGCGLGRHSIFFAKKGFDVTAFDLSEDGAEHLRKWATREKLNVDVSVADMLKLPYKDDSFDCLFAYLVISHTDTKHIKCIIEQIKRVLKPGGEFYLTLCSKETWSFTDAGFPKIDENTVIKTDDGPEKDIPHFYVDLDDVFDLFCDFEIIRIRHIDDCYFEGKKQNSKHYFVLGRSGKVTLSEEQKL